MVKMTDRNVRDKAVRKYFAQITRLIRDHLKAIVPLLDAVTADDVPLIECVHHLRTETRRADVALRLFKSWLPRRRRQCLRAQMHEIRHKAGLVRDLDVVIPLLEELMPQISTELLTWLRQYASRRRIKNSGTLKRHCKQLLDQNLAREIQSLVKRVRGRDEKTMTNVHDVIMHELRRIASIFRKSVKELSADLSQLHEVRINGRRLRYALEQFKELNLECSTDQICRSLSELQDLLGRTNDHQSILRFLRNGLASCNQPEMVPILNQTIATLEVATANAITEAMRITTEKWINFDSGLNPLTESKHVPSA